MTDLAQLKDSDPLQTEEWQQALLDILRYDGVDRAKFILAVLVYQLQVRGIVLPEVVHSPYQNTIPVEQQPPMPGDREIERRITNIHRWNAAAMVVKAGKKAAELGGHIASYASAAWLYEVGFNHFFRAPTKEKAGDILYIQGHSAPGIYARAFLEGRLDEEQLTYFRQEIQGQGRGLSSYPHPWLMPDFWQIPTVSMGLGPIQAIYQARFLKYLHNRGLLDTSDRHVWVFCGDGEMDEPESLGAISVAVREQLDNLIFVINCNLQRLDGPVRGNGKIIQELEGIFRGAGWHVIKVIWGNGWDELLAKDKSGLLLKRMMECRDGEYQNFKAKGGAYTRKHFFNKYPELAELVADWTDEQIEQLERGGHEPEKIYAAYHEAVNQKGRPTVILAKTVKGYGMGEAGESLNITHQQKKMDVEQLKAYRRRFQLPLSDEQVERLEFYKPPEDSEEITYLKERRKALGGTMLQRREQSDVKLAIPPLDAFQAFLQESGERTFSTTMAFVRLLNILMKDKQLGQHIVPIVPDECRTFGMEGMFRQFGIYSPLGQLYEPVDAEQVMYYREDKKGQILEEGITEAGAMSSWIAAATSYSINNLPMIPFFIYYSMFGFQRIGDLAWAAGDSRARGFLIGGTSGRTTLAGEGLQHQDGHSHLFAAAIPPCRAYDPTFAYELAVIIQDGMRRMYQENESVFYYITVLNENYSHPGLPEGVEQGIIKGMYRLKKGKKNTTLKVQLLGCGAILREVIAAGELLEDEFAVSADIWSVPSFTELHRDGMSVERYNLLHPEAEPKISYVAQCLNDTQGPIIAATDYLRLFAEQIRPYVPRRYMVLGTDGFGRSDTRKQLRHFFEVDRYYIAVAALYSLAEEGLIDRKQVTQAMKKYKIDPEKPAPWLV